MLLFDIGNDPIHKYTKEGDPAVTVPGLPKRVQLAASTHAHLFPEVMRQLEYTRILQTSSDVLPPTNPVFKRVLPDGSTELMYPAFLYEHPNMTCSTCSANGTKCLFDTCYPVRKNNPTPLSSSCYNCRAQSARCTSTCSARGRNPLNVSAPKRDVNRERKAWGEAARRLQYASNENGNSGVASTAENGRKRVIGEIGLPDTDDDISSVADTEVTEDSANELSEQSTQRPARKKARKLSAEAVGSNGDALASLSSLAGTIQEKVAEARKTRGNDRGRITKLEKQVAQRDALLDAMEQDREDLVKANEEKLEAHEAEVQRSRDALAGKLQENEQLKKRISQLESRTPPRAANADPPSFKSEAFTKKEYHDALPANARRKIADQETRIKQQATQLAAQEQEIARLETDVVRMGSTPSSFGGSHSHGGNSEMQILQLTNKRLENENASYKVQVTKLRDESSRLRKEVDEVRDQLETERAESASTSNAWAITLRGLSSEKRQLQQALTTLRRGPSGSSEEGISQKTFQRS